MSIVRRTSVSNDSNSSIRKTVNSSSSSNGNYITIGNYRISRERAMLKSTSGLEFLNPAEDFIGVVECLGNIRHIEKKGEMKQDLDVIDCRIIAGAETREVEEETPQGILKKREQRQYHDEAYSIVLTKAVLLSKFKELQKELQDLTGKRIIIIGLGKAEEKNYFDYYVATEEKAKEEGILQIAEKV